MKSNAFIFCLRLWLTFFSIQPLHAQKAEIGGYQVQNKATGLLLRPLDARSEDGTPIIVYPKTTWRCLTWELIPSKDSNIYFFKNYFTGKTFTARESKEGAEVVEVPLDKTKGFPSWKVVYVSEGYYKIESPSGLVLTVEGEGVNAKVVLKAWNKEAKQLWKMLDKPDHFTG
jgi:hypothetical protein